MNIPCFNDNSKVDRASEFSLQKEPYVFAYEYNKSSYPYLNQDNKPVGASS
jgi:hypothetical protein